MRGQIECQQVKEREREREREVEREVERECVREVRVCVFYLDI